MNRYAEIRNKNPREIVLLRGLPCAWGACTFCTYITDNAATEEEANRDNMPVLDRVTGKFGVLEVINSGSCFELPPATLERIRQIVCEKAVHRLFLESHWQYRDRIPQMRAFFPVPITFKIGVETFDEDFRNRILNKNIRFSNVAELKKHFDSPCLMVAVQGQTREMIDRDMDIILREFDHATVNVFVNTGSPIRRDDELARWFCDKYAFLRDDPHVEVLFHNTDFGVGD